MGCNLVTVLVVDDNEDNLFLMATALRKIGLNVLEAINGKIAVELFVMAGPKAIVTDLEMPVMGGLELIGEIRSMNSAVPIVAMSAGGPSCLRSASETGADLCFAKPFDFDVVAQSVFELVAS